MLPNASIDMLLALLLAVASPDAIATSRLAGTWSCTTAANSDVVIEAKPDDSGKLSMVARWQNVQPASLSAPVRGAWTQTFEFEPASGQWIVDNLTDKG